MIPNPNQLTAELRSMTDVQLQQYAQLHKNDPYILPMALSESNARKMMRMRAQAKQFQPQPTERDKALMSMQEHLPEEVGIGALPAQNLESMADGGIVGYADGGGMMGGYNLPVGYEPNRTPLLSYADGGYVEHYAERGYTGDVLGQIPGYSPATSPMLPQAGSGEDEKLIPRLYRQVRESAVKDRAAKIKAKMDLGTATKDEIKWFQTNAPKLSEVASPAATPPIEGMIEPTTGRAVQAAVPAPAGATPAPAPVPASPAGGAPGLISATPARYAQTPMQGYQSALEETPLVDATASQREALTAALRNEPQQALSEFEKTRKKPEELYKGREERYTKREADLAKEGAMNEGLALLTAAGAILKPGGLAAGASEAIKAAVPQYAAGVDKLRAAQERIQEGRDRLEELRQNYDELTVQERLRLKREGNKAIIEGQKLELDAANAAQQQRHKVAGAIFEAGEKRGQIAAEQAGRERIAKMQLGQEPSDLRTLRALLADPKLMETYQKMQTTKGSGLAGLLGKYADPMELEMLKQQDPQLHAAVVSAMQRMMMPAPVTGTPSGPVRQ